MALKAEVIIGDDSIVWQVNVLYAASPLDGANGISFSISKALNASGGILQGRGGHTQWVKVSAEYLIQVPIMNKLLRVGSHKQRKLPTHVMNRFSKVCLSNLGKLIGIAPFPELNSSIPSARYHDGVVVLLEHVEILDWLSMRTDIDDLISLQIPLLDVIVSACK